MSFLKGLTSGQQIAQGWLDTYEKSRKDKEASDLKVKREGILTAKPEYSQDYTAAQREQFGYMTEARDNEGRPFYNVQTDSSGNYSVTPNFPTGQTPQVGLTEGLQDNADTAGQLQARANLQAAQAAPQPIALPRERVANFLGGRVEGDLTPERMEILRSRALANTLVDPLERQRALVQMDENERAARRAEQVNTLTGLQIDAAKTTAQRENEVATREEANRTAVLQVGQMLQTGGNIDIPSLYKVASATGADPTVLVKTAANFLDITEKSAKATTEKLLRDIDAASVSPTKFNTLLKNSFDPDPNDNLSPELRPAAGGGFQVFYGDKPMTQVFKDTADMPALSQMASFYRDRLSGNPLATAVQIEALRAKRAATRASDRSGIRAPDINEYVDTQGNVRLIDVGALPRDKNNQPILPQGLRKLPTGTATAKDLSPQQGRAFDALKNTDAFKAAVERGNQVRVRELLIANNIPPETFFGAAALPPGAGAGTARNPFDEPIEPPKPARPAAASRAEQPPSPAALRALRERSVGVLTPRSQLEAAANAGNPAAVRELERRVAGEEASAQRNFENTQQQMRGLQ